MWEGCDRVLQLGQLLLRDQHAGPPRLRGDPLDEAAPFKRDDYLVNGGQRRPEVVWVSTSAGGRP